MKTLEEFVNHRRSEGREISVFVRDDSDTPSLNSRPAAHRVASVLGSDDAPVVDLSQDSVEASEMEDGGVLLITHPPSAGQDALDEIEDNITAVRAQNIVVLADQLPEYLLDWIDARVVADGGTIESVGRLQTDSYEGDVYEIEMDGLTKTG